MLPDQVLNPGPPTYESGALPIVLRGPAKPRMTLISIVMTLESDEVSMVTIHWQTLYNAGILC